MPLAELSALPAGFTEAFATRAAPVFAFGFSEALVTALAAVFAAILEEAAGAAFEEDFWGAFCEDFGGAFETGFCAGLVDDLPAGLGEAFADTFPALVLAVAVALALDALFAAGLDAALAADPVFEGDLPFTADFAADLVLADPEDLAFVTCDALFVFADADGAFFLLGISYSNTFLDLLGAT